jgi:hypothetical protein
MSKTSHRRPLSPEELGRKGELLFEHLCNDAHLIANKSTIDTMGWDYRVECPYPDPDMATPLDKRPHPVECKVQVKTVWNGNNSVALKLSAAERLAKADLPSFIAVLSVDVKLNLVAMHVFHMLDQHLEYVLKRLRKATAEGSLKINHVELTFNLRDGVSIRPDGVSLSRFITDACGDNTSSYHLKKQDQKSNLGFRQTRYEGKFTVKAKSESEIAELFLGLRPAVLVAFETNEIRFGIKLPNDAGGSGMIKITPHPVCECKIIVKGRDDGPFVSIPGALYLPPQRNQNGDIPFRISTKLFEVFVNGTDLKIDNKMAEFTTKPVLIRELLAALKFHSVIAKGGGRFTVLAKNKQILSCEIGTVVDQNIFEYTNKRIQLVEMMAAIFKAADAQSRPVSFSDMADKAIDLKFLETLINNKRDAVDSITFQLAQEFEFPPQISEALLIKRLCFPDFAVAYYTVMDATLSVHPPDVVLGVDSISLRDITVISGGDDAFDTYIEEAQLTTGIALSLIARSD